MFESDDFDQVLSQFEFPEDSYFKPSSIDEGKSNECVYNEPSEKVITNISKTLENHSSISINSSNTTTQNSPKISDIQLASTKALSSTSNKKEDCFASPKYMKRKIINSHFDHKSKRKFPGPAGLLTGTLEESYDETVTHIALLSQDIEYNENQHSELFDSPLWMRLLDDINSWHISDVEPIKTIKEQAQKGHLRKRKAQTVTAFVESVDRSVPDPLITLRDATGNIQCTLHRDAWSIFSLYIASDICALVLRRPTILTTGSAFKKHYLNITLNNIYAIYSSATNDDDVDLPKGYTKILEDNFTVIKTERIPQNVSINPIADTVAVDVSNDVMIDELESIFSDDLF